ncbi:DUF887 family protein [Hyaloraphidium curvatum]|nr:DUF887 family protein [Hyaloraphidium curvatum]
MASLNGSDGMATLAGELSRTIALFPLHHLEDHLPTAAITALLCQLAYLSSFTVFESLSKAYRTLERAKKIDFGTRVVSTCFSTYAVAASLMTVGDPRLGSDKLFGYSYEAGQVMGVALGYFLWDLFICTQHFRLFGPGFLVHAICCINIYLWIMRPFLMYFGVKVLLRVDQTPFVNNHWFMDKLGYTGSSLQLANGLLLIGAFFGIRIVYGSITSTKFFYEMISRRDELPPYLPYIYGIGNLTLNFLNLFWFSKMIRSVHSRFHSSETEIKKQ